MASEKINITNRLRDSIIERRKQLGISAYNLSEESGHSKFWLSNIEGGKTKKISKDDLLSIFSILCGGDEDEVTYEIERVLNQQIGDERKQWYELIDISPEYTEIYDDIIIQIKLKKLVKDLYEGLSRIVFNLPIHQQQAALTAVQNLYYSIYLHPELAFALMNIPIYGVSVIDVDEQDNCLSELLSISAKYADLVDKNQSMDTIKQFQDWDKQRIIQDKNTIHSALNNFKSMLQLILDYEKIEKPNLHNVLNQFYSSVVFAIERVRKGTVGTEIRYESEISNGNDFCDLIDECCSWFDDYQDEYDLPSLEECIDNDLIFKVKNFLKSINKISAFPED